MPEAAHFPTPAPNPTPKIGVDALPREARKRITHERVLSETAYGRLQGQQATLAGFDAAILECQHTIRRSQSSAKPSKEVEAEAEAEIAALRAEKAAAGAEYERQSALLPGSKSSVTNDFGDRIGLRKFAMKNHQWTPPPGVSLVDAMKECGAENVARRKRIEALSKAPIPVEDQLREMDALISEAEGAMETFYASVRGAEPLPRGHFTTRSPRVPTITIAHENSIQRIPDAQALLFGLFGDELRERIAIKVRGRHDAIGKDAVGLEERTAEIKRLRAEIVETERDSECIYQLSLKTGEACGPRIASNPLAILDLVELT